MPARPVLVSAPPELDLARPEEVGLNAAQLARIDDHLRRRYLEPEKIAGCLTLVARGGMPAWLSAQGLMDRERNRVMRTRHDLPHLLDDQTDHLGRPDAALRGRGTSSSTTRSRSSSPSGAI